MSIGEILNKQVTLIRWKISVKWILLAVAILLVSAFLVLSKV